MNRSCSCLIIMFIALVLLALPYESAAEGFGSKEEAMRTYNAWMGSHKDELLIHWGLPKYCTPLSKAREMCEWEAGTRIVFNQYGIAKRWVCNCSIRKQGEQGIDVQLEGGKD
jgi:hypothetical protein